MSYYPTPRFSRFALALFAFLLGALFVFAATLKSQSLDTLDAEAHEVLLPLSKQQQQREYVKNHIVNKSDTISVLVTRVVDGDTFICTSCFTCGDSVRIRVLELDTFEKSYIPRLYRQARLWNISPDEARNKGRDATQEARKLLEGKQVKLHRGNKSEPEIDIYDRLLRYVILPDRSDYSELMRTKGLNARK